MDLTLDGDVVRAGSRAREQFYDSQGYGHVHDGELDLAPVEAAHLCHRGDIESVDGMDLGELLATDALSATAFFVYTDLRSRGFYLTPAREGWVENPAGIDFVVYPRGKGPWDDPIAYRIRVVGERDTVPAASLGDCTLAVVDEESEITYFETSSPEISGTSTATLPETSGQLLPERVLCWDPPEGLYEEAFYGQRFESGLVQLSLVEAAYLASVDGLSIDGGADAIIERGRRAEGERFDRRLAVYESLRNSGVVPKTGFKFGADFRTYADVESVEDLGHSDLLVRVLPKDHTFDPRDLALDVRLAHGVRKTMVFAVVGGGDIEWLSVERLTP